MKQLCSKWFDGFKGDLDEKDKLRNAIRASTVALGILTSVIEKDLETLQNPRAEDYDSPSWAYKQADRNGQIKALKNILQMTKIGTDQ